MGPEEGESVCSVGFGSMGSTGFFSGPDIATQVQELEKRIAQQVGGDTACLSVLHDGYNSLVVDVPPYPCLETLPSTYEPFQTLIVLQSC